MRVEATSTRGGVEYTAADEAAEAEGRLVDGAAGTEVAMAAEEEEDEEAAEEEERAGAVDTDSEPLVLSYP